MKKNSDSSEESRDCTDETRLDRCDEDDIREQIRTLPISPFKTRIIQLASNNEFLIITGETGSGKSTQIPQYLLDSDDFLEFGFKEKRNRIRIAVTQPRRVAAMSMARRVSEERGTVLGVEVGYTIRFDDKSHPNTVIRYITDGCLLRESLHDVVLSAYDLIILDEAHERSMHTDVLFALIKQAVRKRNGNLKVIVTSATLDTNQFSTYFENCPVLEIPGRSFPVEVVYVQPQGTKRVESCVNAAIRLHISDHVDMGHILVFLTGKEECELACVLAHKNLQMLLEGGKSVADLLVIPLYGALPSEEQQFVFKKTECRKLIFTTNIAETSLTVDGVSFVIDSGYVKQKCYNANTGMDALQTTRISQVQAEQRRGRAGRTHAGKCFRLYSEQTYFQLDEITAPEILRSNLASVVLQLKDMGINDVVHFDFLEPPETSAIIYSLKQLFWLDAIDESGFITEIGKTMSEFPLDPPLSRCLIESVSLKVSEDMVTLAGVLSAENIWYSPSKQNPESLKDAVKCHKRFHHPSGDHVTLVDVYNKFQNENLTGDWCRRNYIHFRALRQASEIRRQIADQMSLLSLPLISSPRKISGTNLRKALCRGYYYQTARPCNREAGLWLSVAEGVLVRPEPGSVLDDLEGSDTDCWLLYSSLGGSSLSQGVMRCVSIIQKDWIEEVLPRIAGVNLNKLISGDGSTSKCTLEKQLADTDTTEKRKLKINFARERYLNRTKKIKIP
eukprot:GHVL01019283.1.p1 GENE.GHVL01019283.1~~GHVL01019283.1.p1  ORF type:complete len:731 (+),score=109.31 GHVL01019283.1:4564-6756(+)